MIQNLKFARINTDADEHELKPEQGEYLMMENLVPPQRGVGRGYVRNSMDGTEETTINDPEYPIFGFSRKTIGTYEDKPTGKIYFFVYTGDYNRIMEYDPKTKTSRRIIRSQKFSWTTDTKITGVVLLDGVLYWTDPVLQYIAIQDQTQLAEIDYNVREITSATLETFFFNADLQAGPDVNFQHNIQGPLSATAVASDLVAAMIADSGFNTVFTATLGVGSTVIKIKAISQPGTIKLTAAQDIYYNYYQTNFVREPVETEDYFLYPIPPAYKPLITPVNDPLILINKIIDKNWQFAHRVIYLNNQITVFSPFSDIHPTPRFPELITDTGIDNKLRIQISIPKPDYTKSIEIAARTSEVGDWFIIKTLDRSEFFGANGIYIYEFTGTEQQIAVATADAIKQQEGTPRESVDLQLQKNKLFVIDNLTGYNYEENDMSIDISILEEVRVEGSRYYKEGGLYNLATRFFDENMRTDGTVHKVTQINIPENPSTSWDLNPTGSGKLPSRKQYLSVTPVGKPPIWARYFKFVKSDELRYGSFMQFHTWVHYYNRPQLDSDIPSNGIAHYYMNGNQYTENSSINNLNDYRYLHLHLPTNINIVPERGMIVQVLAGNNTGGPDQFTVLDVQGNMLVLEQPIDLINFKYPGDILFIELYNPKQTTESNNFYEIGSTYDVLNPGEDTRSFTAGPFRINGDLFNIENNDEKLMWKYDWDDYIKHGSTEDEQGLRKDKYTWGYSESYTKSYTPTKIQEVRLDINTAQAAPGEFTLDFGYIPDQSLATRNLGRPAPLLQNVREENRPSTLRWSNDYIENAAINGLHTFEPLNEYPLPLERGAITKLQSSGEDVMLAIHRAGVTSLYIGKGIIRSADLNPTLVTTDAVIGTDNELKHSYGSVHPESITEIDGNVYFWDGNRNEPVRYAQNGLIPMASTFFTKVFFKKTIPSIFGSPDQYNCKTGYDRLLDMIWWNFDDGVNKVTIGFHEIEKAWICKAGFTPEFFESSGETFLGFVDGIPWLHNADPVNVNTFYGTYYPSKATLIINLMDRIEKAWDGIVVDSNKIWDCPAIYNEEGQSSNLVANDFVWRDNLYYADFLRDINTPIELLTAGQVAIRHGKFLSSQVLTIEMELNDPTYHYLQSVGIAATLKAGHNLQTEQQER